MKKVLAAAAVLAIAGAANAQSYSVDANVEWTGSDTGSRFSDTFTLPGIQSIDSVVIDLAHSWAADIEFTLESPAGDVFQLIFDQGGSSDMGDGAGYTLANVVGYTVVESGGANTWGGGDPNPSGSYDALSWFSGPFAGGDWILDVVDDAGGDGGAIGRITVNYTVPAPGALALLGLGGLVGVRRRR